MQIAAAHSNRCVVNLDLHNDSAVSFTLNLTPNFGGPTATARKISIPRSICAFVGDDKVLSDENRPDDRRFGKITLSPFRARTTSPSPGQRRARSMCKGGDWGMDEAMKRIPARAGWKRRFGCHQLANYTIIRNWVGQSTSEDLLRAVRQVRHHALGRILPAQPGRTDPTPTDLDTLSWPTRGRRFVRFRNHPFHHAIWCGRNEGFPPKEKINQRPDETDAQRTGIADAALSAQLHLGPRASIPAVPIIWRPNRRISTNLTRRSRRRPAAVSIPDAGIGPRHDAEGGLGKSINDDWAEHDLAAGRAGLGTGIPVRAEPPATARR